MFAFALYLPAIHHGLADSISILGGLFLSEDRGLLFWACGPVSVGSNSCATTGSRVNRTKNGLPFRDRFTMVFMVY